MLWDPWGLPVKRHFLERLCHEIWYRESLMSQEMPWPAHPSRQVGITHQEGAEEVGEEHFAASVSPAPPAAE